MRKRVQEVKNLSGPSLPSYASGVQYKPYGAIQQLTLGNLVVEATGFDDTRMQPTTVAASHAGSTLLSLGLSYCAGAYPCSTNNGNVLAQSIYFPTRTVGQTQIPGLSVTQNYGYDPLNRLASFQETGGQPNQTSNYDAFGNRWVTGWIPYAGQTPAANVFPNNRWADGSGVNYDPAGNQTQVLLSGNASRNFTYDAENRVQTATIPGMPPVTYVYDGDGRRVQKTVGSTTTTYVYDALGQLAAEYGGPAPSVTGTMYLTADHLGSTRLVTDSGGNPLRRYDYAPFGEELTPEVDGRGAEYSTGAYPTTVADVLSQKFTSKERDAETGLDFFGARYDSSAQGRFTSPDPHTATLLHLLNPQRWNMYAYAVNDPLSYVDPDGRDAIAVDFGNLAAGTGHWAIISVNRDGSATFSEYGPRGGAKPVYPGQYTSYDLATKISVGSKGVPTAETLAAVQKELAQHEGQPQGSIALAYYKTKDTETASLNAYIKAAGQAQAKGNIPFYFVGFNDCRDYCLAGLHAAGIATSHYANLNLGPNFLFQFLKSAADTTYPSKPKKKEKADATICYEGQPGCQVGQEQR